MARTFVHKLNLSTLESDEDLRLFSIEVLLIIHNFLKKKSFKFKAQGHYKKKGLGGGRKVEAI